MISGLPALQAMSTENTDTRDSLNTAEQRIRIIAKNHEMLYIKGVVKTVNMREHITEVINGFHPLNKSSRISFMLNIPDIEVESEKALTICMIVDELVSSSVKYAFIGEQEGIISVNRFQESPDALLCEIRDNGRGFTDDTHRHGSSGIGHRLIESFVIKQLSGRWKINSEKGTRHRLKIPLKND